MADIRAGIYTRISKADEGDFIKVDDQERICREHARHLGWEVAEVYCDHSKSAWQRNRKRPAWDKMLADVDSGKINAIVVFHGDRLVRRGQDLAKLLDLSETKGVKLASPSGTRNLDTDRFELWIRAAVAEEESQRTSERRKAQYERWRREGRVRPGGRGGRPFGFETDGLTAIPAEQDIIREAARRMLAGESAYSIARDLAERGVRTPSGLLMQAPTLRKLLQRPRLAGLMPDGASKAAWAPVLDRADWEVLQAVIAARASRFAPPGLTNARRYLLSGIAACGACGKPMAAWSNSASKGRHLTGYACLHTGCRKVYRSQPLLDEFVTAAVISRLAHPLNPAGRIPETPGLAAEFAALTGARGELMALLADYRGGHSRLLLSRLEGLEARLAELRELAAGDAGARLAAQYAGMTREWWDSLPLGVRRSLVSSRFTVEVLPASKRGPGFRVEDVRLTPR